MSEMNNQTDIYNGSQNAGTTDHKVLESAADPTPGFLAQKVVAGSNVTITEVTDPTLGKQVQINATAGAPVLTNFGLATDSLMSCRTGTSQIPNVNNAGSCLATLVQVPASFRAANLSCFCRQTGGGFITLGIFSQSGALLAKSAPFVPGSLGILSAPIAFNGAGAVITYLDLTGGTLYYFGIHGTQSANGAGFYGSDAGGTFGPSPWLAWVNDNTATIPNQLAGSENATRFYILAKAV